MLKSENPTVFCLFAVCFSTYAAVVGLIIDSKKPGKQVSSDFVLYSCDHRGVKVVNVSVSQLPGIGQKISLKTSEDSMLVIIVHHTGKCELYFFDDPDSDEADFAMDLSPDETRELAAQLLGATYQPVDVDKLRMFKRQIIVDYITLKENSRLAYKTIEESDIRNKTGATIIGIVDGDDLIAVPEADTMLKPGDVLMSIGKDEQIATLTQLAKRCCIFRIGFIVSDWENYRSSHISHCAWQNII